MAVKKTELQAPHVDPQDLALTGEIGSAIALFVKGALAFFTQAHQLEARAAETLTAAKALTTPTTLEADEKVQTFIRRANADKKEVEGHWGITAKVHQLHRRLTARRAKAVDALTEAAEHANRLHNTYTEAERRRVEQENAKRQREAEEQAAKERQAELNRLDAEREKLEAASKDLSEREQYFVTNYTTGIRTAGNATESAKHAGFKDAKKAAQRLLNAPKIQKAITAALKAKALLDQSIELEAAPLDVVPVEEVSAQLTKGGERTTWTGTVTDEAALVAAVIAGKHGIPWDVLQVNPVKLNECARSLHEIINRWPGVQATKSTKVVG